MFSYVSYVVKKLNGDKMMLKNNYKFLLFLVLGILLMTEISISKEIKPKIIEKTVPISFMQAKTVYQVNSEYKPRIAIHSDGVIIHRHGDDLETIGKVIKGWKDKIPCVGRMFFADSDAANEYWSGKWDGIPHPDVREMDATSNIVMCAHRPYIVPTKGWIKYLEDQAKSALKNGAVAILPEEPLGHVHAGYSKSFKKLWEENYKFPWQAENSSDIARYLTSQLQGKLYLDLENSLAKTTKEYNKNAAFIVPIHSIFGNIAASLSAPLGMSVNAKGIDGYIGQIWTGPVNWSLGNYISSNKSFFASAYALYDYFTQLTVGTDKKLWLLVDPVEDDPNHTWNEFTEWYEHCVAAMLLMPEVDSYEIMPWPSRIYLPGHQTGGGTPAPENFRMEILTISQVLQDVPKGGEWLSDDSSKPMEGIAVAISDSAMYLNKPFPKLQGLYGMLLPLISQGIPVSSFVMERVQDKNYADLYKLVILSYEDFKPEKPEMNVALAEWVKRGGTLVIFGSDGDELDKADYFWWHKLGFKSPVKHLLAQFNKTKTRKEKWKFGKGTVIRKKMSPNNFVGSAMVSKFYLPVIELAIKNSHIKGEFKTPGNFCMKRGNIIIAHSEKNKISREGKFVDIFNVNLPVINEINLKPGESGLYKDVSEILKNGKEPVVLHSTLRLVSQEYKNEELKFVVKGPEETPAVARIFCPGKKKINVTAINSKGKKIKVEIKKDKETYLLKFPNSPDGVTMTVTQKLSR